MNEKSVFEYLKDLGCCDGCCFRYLGLKSPNVYENTKRSALQNDQRSTQSASNKESEATQNQDESLKDSPNTEVSRSTQNGSGADDPPSKRRKWSICVSCIGVLQEESWPECLQQVQHVLDKKRYECTTFACALSAPMATLLREKAVTLMLQEKFADYDSEKSPTPLKEAWKWSFGPRLAAHINKTLDSGAISPLLITLNMEYPHDLEELEPLKRVSPALFSTRSQHRRRFTVEFTRRCVEQALDGVSLDALRREGAALPGAAAAVRCVSVSCAHEPVHLGGRYIKLSRSLPQTPWLVRGVRMMESSVQEIIFQPLAELYDIPAADTERKLKFISAGREDVDVRCLGRGRPFAIEVSDPGRSPTAQELRRVCERISTDGRVLVHDMCTVDKEQLTQLKLGEETKCKTYEALCIKLTHSDCDQASGVARPVTVTQTDIDNINSYSNVKEGESGRVRLSQRTPIRVLHRRPLLTRERMILDLEASKVPGHECLFTVRVRTTAGTYIKEWAHGECGRTAPALRDALRARADILALDVTTVHLDWPHTDTTAPPGK